MKTLRPESDLSEIEHVARAFRIISQEISYDGLANSLLQEALNYSGAMRGGVLLSEGGELLAKADASFPRERARFFTSSPPVAEFQLPADLSETVLDGQETVVRTCDRNASPLIGLQESARAPTLSQLFLPLVHRERTIGVLYLESEHLEGFFTPKCISVMSMLASQTAVSFESARLFEALRETNMWMVKGQQIGRMGSYRWNTRTLLSRGSREVYRILDIDQNLNPVPFEAFRDRVHPEDLPALERALTKALSSEAPFSHEYRVLHKDGTIRHVMAVGQFDRGPTGDLELEGIITDCTEQKAADQALTDARAELARAASLASIGELAGSIIHEINQPMTGIITSAEACLRWLSRDPAELVEARKSAIRITQQSHRASAVVAGLRSLVRDSQLTFTDVAINDAIEEVLILSRRDIERNGVTVRRAFGTSMPIVRADRVQLQQVVFNLVRNAVDAMAASDSGDRVLTVSTTLAADHVAVTISDTGVGIPCETRARLFDPLYTTKSDGLGLGLSLCRKIIAAHKGRLWTEDGTTRGAVFTFSLPYPQLAQAPRGSQ